MREPDQFDLPAPSDTDDEPRGGPLRLSLIVTTLAVLVTYPAMLYAHHQGAFPSAVGWAVMLALPAGLFVGVNLLVWWMVVRERRRDEAEKGGEG